MALAAYEFIFNEQDGEVSFFGSADCKRSAGRTATEDY